MGGRSWYYKGFTDAARAILEAPVGGGKKAPSNRRGEEPYRREEYAREYPWYQEVNILYRYHFKDGRVLEGYVQAEPDDGGPVTFMALRDAKTGQPIPETLWPDDEIAQ